MGKETRWREKIKIAATAAESSPRREDCSGFQSLVCLSKPIHLASVRLRFKTEVKKMRREASPQFAVGFGKAIFNWGDAPKMSSLQGVCLGVCFKSLEMTFKEI